MDDAVSPYRIQNGFCDGFV